jgi:two-component system, chemotaxis family, protein-glutamate methylesterase/glutaminase
MGDAWLHASCKPTSAARRPVSRRKSHLCRGDAFARTLGGVNGARPLQSEGPNPDLVVIGASAGGVEALKLVVASLPADLPAAVCIVLHIAPEIPSALAAILRRSGPLPCRAAVDDELLCEGEILVAPPDRHLVVEDAKVHLTVGPRENGHRPAVDVLFRSAAAARRSRVVGVILSGARDDGAAGLALIKANGGTTVVQSPADAMYSGMPVSALEHVVGDAVLPAAAIGETIASIAKGENIRLRPAGSTPPDDPDEGEPLTTVCPECGGVLTEHQEAGMPQWRCHVGHRYSPTSLADAQGARVEAALWTAVRALRDRGALLERMAEQAEGRGADQSAQRFHLKAMEARRQADVVLGALADAAASSLEDVAIDVADAAVDEASLG